MHALRQVLALVPLVLLPTLVTADGFYPPSLQQLPQLDLNIPAGVEEVPLPAELKAKMETFSRLTAWRTELRKAQQVELRVDATPQDAFDAAGAPPGMVVVPLSTADGSQQSWFVSVQARHPDLIAVELLVGQDSNGDGLPQPEELLCHENAAVIDSAYCHLDMRGKTDRPLWAFAHVTDALHAAPGLARAVEVAVSTAYFQLDDHGKTISVSHRDDFIASTTANWAIFQFSARPEQNQLKPSHDMAGILFTSAEEDALVWPIRIDFGPLLAPGDSHGFSVKADRYDDATVILSPGETNYGLYVDNPGQDRLDVTLSDPYSTLTVWKEPFPTSSIDSFLDSNPATDSAHSLFLDPQAFPGAPNFACAAEALPGCKSLKVDAGRWRFAIHNTRDDGSAYVRVAVRLSKISLPEVRPAPGLHVPDGNYYVPQRSGDGLFLERVGDLQLIHWYTFDLSGDPIWYIASASPNDGPGVAGSIDATLYQVNLISDVPHALAAGHLVLTQIEGSNDLMFSWNLLTYGGTNRLVLAAAASCARVDGQDLPLSGHWFAPTSPGWGMNTLALGESMPLALYFYDGRGWPRWLFAGLAREGKSYRSELFQSMHGSYPSWSYQKPDLTKVGSASINFDDGNSATFSASAQLLNSAPPGSSFLLQGSFAVQGAHIVRATDAVGCRAP